MEKPLLEKSYLLEKFAGKGGWTYARIPEILQDKHAPFGWVRVRGSIDGVEIKSYHLMPMGNGQLFLPVKAEIRKKIGKQAGDRINVILYADDRPVEIPEELSICLLDEPGAYENFLSYPAGEQKLWIEWIFSARKEETKIARLAKTVDFVQQKKKFAEARESSK